ncbi:MAG: hypothetical protein JWQ75_3518, partial [Pseudarthrobacter sp.]|nr:hypothetical protein [Pseudarthrobacter sp.]
SRNMLGSMERPDIDDNCPPLVVLDGQTSIEELFAELGLEWRAEAGMLPGLDLAGGIRGQDTLF